jgi:hypothetical protein
MQTSCEEIRLVGDVAWTGPTGTGIFETGFKVVRKIG